MPKDTPLGYERGSRTTRPNAGPEGWRIERVRVAVGVSDTPWGVEGYRLGKRAPRGQILDLEAF